MMFYGISAVVLLALSHQIATTIGVTFLIVGSLKFFILFCILSFHKTLQWFAFLHRIIRHTFLLFNWKNISTKISNYVVVVSRRCVQSLYVSPHTIILKACSRFSFFGDPAITWLLGRPPLDGTTIIISHPCWENGCLCASPERESNMPCLFLVYSKCGIVSSNQKKRRLL